MFNSKTTISRCIKSLKSQSIPKDTFEIIVVDDGSTDGSVDYARKAGADKIIVSKHGGTGQTRNRGFKEAKGKILASLDSDCEAENGWLETITKELKKYDAITGPIKNGIDNPISWAEYLLQFSEFNEYKKKSKIRFLPGCNQALTRESYDLAGGFNNPVSSDDVFFGRALELAGKSCYFVPEMKICHRGLIDMQKFISKFYRRGRGFIITRRNIPSSPNTILASSKWFIPLIFLGMIFSKTRYSIKSKKLGKFLKNLPIIIRGITSYCKGAWYEIQKK